MNKLLDLLGIMILVVYIAMSVKTNNTLGAIFFGLILVLGLTAITTPKVKQ